MTNTDNTCLTCGCETTWTNRICTYCREEQGQTRGEMVASTTNHQLRWIGK